MNRNCTICIFPYCHSDWAWGHSRYWHANRYIQVLDDVIDILEQYPNFRFFFDSFVEFLPPFVEARKDKLSKLNEFVKEGKISIVGGQFCNLRPATAGEESFIRNILLGRAEIRQLLPDAKFIGFANLDTAVGHSQLPQMLKSSEYKYYLFWRPEWGLDKQNIPGVFCWAGQDESTITAIRQCYADLSAKTLFIEPLEENLEKIREHILDVIKPFLNQKELSFAIIYAGMDDARPLRDIHDDTPLPLFELIKLWNGRFDEKLTFCTPDEFFSKLNLQTLPKIEGIIDQADVCYNGPFGSNNLQTLRLKAERSIQYAEMIFALFGDVFLPEIDNKFDKLWKKLLKATAHATQFLFDKDYKKLKLLLENTMSEAEKIANETIKKKFEVSVPQDADTITLINPLPYERTEFVSIPLTNIDLSKKSFVLLDGSEKLATQINLPKNPNRAAEVDAIVKLKVPPAGYKQIKLITKNGTTSKPKIQLLPADCILETPNCKIKFVSGKITEIEGKDTKITSTEGIFTLKSLIAKSTADPVLDDAADSPGWMTAALEPSNEAFKIKELKLIESGPLRWSILRTLESTKHQAIQLINVDEAGTIECKTKIFTGQENVMIAMSFPYTPKAKLTCGIPFGSESRNIDDIQYQSKVESNSIERLIPGMFWCYDWIIAQTENTRYGVITPFGDRYWLRPEWNQSEILHLLVRLYAPFVNPSRWEYYSCINRATAGLNEFTHILVTDKSKLNPSSLSRLKQMCIFPIQSFYNKPQKQSECSLVKLRPQNIRFTSYRKVNGELEFRLIELEGKSAEVHIEFADKIRFVRKLNLAGRYLGHIPAEDNIVKFEIKPYKISTIRVAFVPEDVLPEKPIGELKIDKLQSDDIQTLFRFYNSLEISAVEKYRPYGWVITQQALKNGPIKRINTNREISLVVRDSADNIWGHCFIIIHDAKTPTFGIGLHKQLRGKGFGKKIMQEVINIADNTYKLPTVGLTVLKENERAVKLYQSLGFEITEEFTAHDDPYIYLRMIRKRPA